MRATVRVSGSADSAVSKEKTVKSRSKDSASNHLKVESAGGGALSSRKASHQSSVNNNCPKCKGKTPQRPCVEYVEILREEFRVHIDSLVRARMKEFTDFIEEAVTVEDQVDVSQDHIIHAFYREHNSLNKMHENLRLLEYKRKVYAEKRKQKNSNSPEREQNRRMAPTLHQN